MLFHLRMVLFTWLLRLVVTGLPTAALEAKQATCAESPLQEAADLELVAEEGSTLVYVTHSDELAARADLRWHLHSGVLET